MNIDTEIAEIYTKISYHRRMLTFLQSRKTQEVLKHLSTKPKLLAEFWEMYRVYDLVGIKQWITHYRFHELDLSELTVTDLRKLGCDLGVSYYYRLTKMELIQEIKHARERKISESDNEIAS